MLDTKTLDIKKSNSKASNAPASSAATATGSKTTAMPQQRTESLQSLDNSPSSGASTSNGEPTREEVAALAYQLWIERGSPHGSHEEDWQKAEEQLRSQPMKRNAAAS